VHRALRSVALTFLLLTGLLVAGGVAASSLSERARDEIAGLIAPFAPAVSAWLLGLGAQTIVPLPPERPPWQSIPFADRLARGGFAKGQPVFIRITKRESQLEVFLKRKDGWRFFQAYPICAWSGALGPKIREGDGQSPEGFYAVTAQALNPQSNYHLSFNLGFPNAYDRALGRTGSFLMVHGVCASVGCYAMTNAGIDEIYGLVEAALDAGQASVPVHAFPFRMTAEALDAEAQSGNIAFWRNLKQGWDAFETAGAPPIVSLCSGPVYGFSAAPPLSPVAQGTAQTCRRIGL
jgi:murein L,D-transpeptidase YafK